MAVQALTQGFVVFGQAWLHEKLAKLACMGASLKEDPESTLGWQLTGPFQARCMACVYNVPADIA